MPRSVEFLYFAVLRDARGLGEERLELSDDVRTVSDLPSFLSRARPELADRLSNVRYAINETFADDGDPIRDGDVIAIIPPVSGG